MATDSVTLSREDYDAICAHVEAIDGLTARLVARSEELTDILRTIMHYDYVLDSQFSTGLAARIRAAVKE